MSNEGNVHLNIVMDERWAAALHTGPIMCRHFVFAGQLAGVAWLHQLSGQRVLTTVMCGGGGGGVCMYPAE